MCNNQVHFLCTGRQIYPRFSVSVSGSVSVFCFLFHCLGCCLNARLPTHDDILLHRCTFYLVRDWFILHILWWVLLYHFHTWTDRNAGISRPHKTHNGRLAKCNMYDELPVQCANICICTYFSALFHFVSFYFAHPLAEFWFCVHGYRKFVFESNK